MASHESFENYAQACWEEAFSLLPALARACASRQRWWQESENRLWIEFSLLTHSRTHVETPPLQSSHGAANNSVLDLLGFEDLVESNTVSNGEVFVSFDNAGAVPARLLCCNGSACCQMETCGDGACGIHACFGLYDAAAGDIRHKEPQRMLSSNLPRNLTELRRCVRPVQQDLIDFTISSLWTDAVVPYVDSSGVVKPGAPNEERKFLQRLRQPSNEPLWNDVLDQIKSNASRSAARDKALQLCNRHSRDVFTEDLDKLLWRPMAINKGLLPHEALPSEQARRKPTPRLHQGHRLREAE